MEQHVVAELDKFPLIRERIISESFRTAQTEIGGVQYARSLRLYRMGRCTILVSREPFGNDDLRWHISVSCSDRAPDWEEIKHVQNALKPGVFFCVPMPPEAYWMNIHEHCFHLEEVKDEKQIEHWKVQV